MTASTGPAVDDGFDAGDVVGGRDQDDRVANELLLVITRLARLARARTGVLPPLQLAVLSRLVRTDRAQRTGEVAAAEGVSAATASRVVAALVDDGLVERAADQADGRTVLLTATTDGRDRFRADHAERIAVLTSHLAFLETEQRAALTAALPVLRILRSRLIDPQRPG